MSIERDILFKGEYPLSVYTQAARTAGRIVIDERSLRAAAAALRRKNAAARRAIARKPSPRPGKTIILEQPLLFGDGRTLDRFEVVANPRNHRTVLYRSPETGGLYRITSVKRRAYRLIDPI